MKAGTVLVNQETKQVGLIYRAKQKDYTFPKGHIDEGESRQQCAIRETEEETGRMCEIPNPEFCIQQYYVSPAEGLCTVHMFIAIDKGPSKKKFEDHLVHDLIWVDIDDVPNKLTYDNLREFYAKILPEIKLL